MDHSKTSPIEGALSETTKETPAPQAPESLWDQAAARLSDKEKARLEFELNSKVDLDDLLSAVSNKRRECEQRQWKVKDHILRDVFSKITEWIQKFVEVGNIAVQFDPGHASLPWAALRFILEIAVQDTQQYSVVITGCEKVANMIMRYRIVETLYLEKQHESIEPLTAHITELYLLILQFLAKVRKFYNKNTASRAVSNVVRSSDGFQGYLNNISEKEVEIAKYMTLVDTEYRQALEENLVSLSMDEKIRDENLKRLLEDLQQPVHRIESKLDALRDDLSSAKRNQILQWISPVPYAQHHNQIRSDIMPGTGEWFSNDDRVLQWTKSSCSSILWLRGIAGSGKSKLLSIFIEQELREVRSPDPAFFYCTRNPAEPERAKPDAVLRSVVRQLSFSPLNAAILPPVLSVYAAREKNGFASGPLNIQECVELIVELSEARPLTTIVIDALDECEPTLRDEVLVSFQTILQSSPSLVKVLVSSRDQGDIVCYLEGCLNLEIQAAQNQADIVQFVRRELDTLIGRKNWLFGKVSTALREKIEHVLLKKARGMFRWVSLQLQFLATLKSVPAVKKRLGELPPTLAKLYEETYTQVLSGYVEEDQRLVTRTLSMLLCMRISLCTQDFMIALSSVIKDDVGLSRPMLLDLCSNLIVLDVELDVFRFAHLSVREFLETTEDYKPENVHATIAELSLSHLSANVFRRSEGSEGIIGMSDPQRARHRTLNLVRDHHSQTTTFVRNAFDSYASFYWPFHFHESKGYQYMEPLRTVSRNFMIDRRQMTSASFVSWHNTLSEPGHHLGQPHSEVSKTLWASNPTIGWKTHLVRSHPPDCLFIACIWDFRDVLGLRLNSQLLNYDFQQSLSVALDLACQQGSYGLAKQLLETGARLEQRNEEGRTPLGTTLIHGHQAPSESHQTRPYLDLMTLLLEYGADSDIALQDDSKPRRMSSYRLQGDELFNPCILHSAAGFGDFAAIVILLQHGASPEITDTDGNTPLDVAAARDDKRVVALLLQRLTHADISTRDIWEKVLQIQNLMDSQDEAGFRTVLNSYPRSAIACRRLEVLLWKAIHEKDEPRTRFILASGLGPDISYWRGHTLNKAAHNIVCALGENRPMLTSVRPSGHSILALLLEFGVDPNGFLEHTVRIDVLTLIGKATFGGDVDLVQLLINAGGNIERKDRRFETAVRLGHVEMVRFFLKRGCDAYKVGERLFSGKLGLRTIPNAEDIANLLVSYGAIRQPLCKSNEDTLATTSADVVRKT